VRVSGGPESDVSDPCVSNSLWTPCRLVMNFANLVRIVVFLSWFRCCSRRADDRTTAHFGASVRTVGHVDDLHNSVPFVGLCYYQYTLPGHQTYTAVLILGKRITQIKLYAILRIYVGVDNKIRYISDYSLIFRFEIQRGIKT
jgi:hypothetical protein